MIKYSLIIPVKEINAYIRESVPNILKIQRDDFEIIVYPDEKTDETWEKTRQIASGPGGPAMKRNLAIRDAEGEILVFIDDDALPQKNFFEILDRDFAWSEILAVGGPAITPTGSKFWQRVSGAMFLSSMSGGFPERYRPVGRKKFADDWPTVNLSVRKRIFEEIGGFTASYWPGEDTVFCLDLLSKKDSQILYDPELVVFHHRREGLLKHVRQVSSYGLHRGFFAKKYPQTSRKFIYFVPSFFVLFVIFGGIASFFSALVFKLYLLGWGFYFLALLKAFYDIYQHEKNILVTLAASYYIFLTHIFYGLRFIQGLLFTKELRSKLR